MPFKKVSFWLPVIVFLLIFLYADWLPSLLYTILPATAAGNIWIEVNDWIQYIHGADIAKYGLIVFIFWQMTQNHRGRGYQLESEKKYQEAVDAYTTAIERTSNDGYSYQRRGQCYQKLGNHEAALTDFDSALRLLSSDESRQYLYLARAHSYHSLKNPIQAIATCTEAITQFPLFADGYLLRGFLSTKQEQTDAALADYHVAINLYRGTQKAAGYQHLGNLYYHLKDYTAAIQSYTQALDLINEEIDANKTRDILFRRGSAHEWEGDFSAALADYDRVTIIKPNDVEAHARKGLMLSRLTRWEETYHACQLTVHLDPSAMLCWLELANAARRLDDKSVWLEAINNARKLAQNSNIYNRACIESVADNIEQALHYLQKCTDEDDWDPEWTNKDPDLEWIRQDPRFEEIVAGGKPMN